MIGYYNYTVVLTYCGLLSALLGVYFSAEGNATGAVICLMVSGLCDMFDGQVAKTRKRTEQEKKFGIQIDSLTDVICFGVLPSAIGYAIGMRGHWYFAVVLLAFPLAALIRLAYFNVQEEERQKKTSERRKEYEGLPVTNIALILPLCYCFRNLAGDYFPYVFAVMQLATGAAFLSRIRVVKAGMRGLLVLIGIGVVLLIFAIRGF